MENNNHWQYRQTIKLILNFWTFLTMILFALDFFSGNKFDSEASAIGVIYLALLGIYVSEKEYIRWKNKFTSRFIGEMFIVAWTVLMAIFVVAAPLSSGAFRVPEQLAIIYTSIVGVFAITQHSKSMHQRNEEKRLLPKIK